MNRKIVWLGLTAVLSLSTVFGTIWSRGIVTLASPRTWHVDDDGQDYPHPDFHNIRDARDYARAGDIIYIYPGSYVDEIIRITGNEGAGISLIGKNRKNTLLVNCEITIESLDVTLSNFTSEDGEINVAANRTTIVDLDILQADYGVRLSEVEEINVTGNVMRVVTNGIDAFRNVRKSVFRNNSIMGRWPSESPTKNMSIGIRINAGTENIVTENNITGCQYAIKIEDTSSSTSKSNKITKNTIVNCDYGIYTSSDHDSIRDNTIRDCTLYRGTGIYCSNLNNATIQNNTLQHVLHGVQFCDAYQCTIQNNNLTHISHDCVYLSYANQCVVRNNFFYDGASVGGSAISLSNSSFTTIKENTICKCGHYGVHVHRGCNNYTIYHNSFFGNGFLVNGTQALDEAGTDHLDNSTLKEGNYWSDYEGEDKDGDGIGDTQIPHQILHYEDRYPLALPKESIPVIYTVVHENYLFLVKPHKEEIKCGCNVFGECITVSRFDFNKKGKSIIFNITVGSRTCHCNITVPKQLLSGAFEVYVDDIAIPCMVSSDQNCYFIYFDSTCFAFSEHSTYNVRILAETAIPLTGDINNDGAVDIFDVTEFTKTYGDKS